MIKTIVLLLNYSAAQSYCVAVQNQCHTSVKNWYSWYIIFVCGTLVYNEKKSRWIPQFSNALVLIRAKLEFF